MKKRFVFVMLLVFTLALVLAIGAAIGTGITYYFLDVQPAKAHIHLPFESQTDEGILIAAIAEGSPAAKAGLLRGDILVKVNDIEVNSIAELWEVLVDLSQGDKVELTVLHGDEIRKLYIKTDQENSALLFGIQSCDAFSIGERYWIDPCMVPEDGRFFFRYHPDFPRMPFPADEIEFPEGYSRAVIIGEVLPQSPAEKAGLSAGDLIVALDGQKLEIANARPDSFAKLIGSFDSGDVIQFTIYRDGVEEDIEVTLDEHPDNPHQGFLGINIAGYIIID